MKLFWHMLTAVLAMGTLVVTAKAVGSARIRRASDNPAQGSIWFEYRKQAGDRTKARTEDLREDTPINEMVGPFLASHWDELLRGEEIHCRGIVMPRRETVAFTFANALATTEATASPRNEGRI